MIVGMIGSLQTFVEVQMFAPEGGRGYGVGTIVFYIWQKAFDSSKMGYACATATVFGLFILSLTVVQFIVSRKWVYEGE
jgi:multiple sugar transport system permease protein